MSDVRTAIGPYPPTKPKQSGEHYDGRTYAYSRCHECGWEATHLEDSQLMEHCIAVAEHRCGDQAVQLDLFGTSTT